MVTDAALAAPREVVDVVREALAAGAPAVQLRAKGAPARELFRQATALLPHVREHGALLFVNDRLDVALGAGADGVHLGPGDLPVAAARRAAPRGFLVGYSTDDPAEALRAQEAGADYLGCGAVFGTTTKADAAGERIGVAGLERVARAVAIPVVGIGGITPENVGLLAGSGAAGVAVVGAVMGAPDAGAAVRALLAPWGGAAGPGRRGT